MKIEDLMLARRNKELDQMELDQDVINYQQYRDNRRPIPDDSEQDEIDRAFYQVQRDAGLPVEEPRDDDWLLEKHDHCRRLSVSPALEKCARAGSRSQ